MQRLAIPVTFIFLSILLLSSRPVPHAIYLSVAEVDRKDTTIPAIVKIKVFANDMEDALANLSGHRIQLLDPSGCLSARLKIETYFQNNFSLTINGAPAKLELARCEALGDAIWFYFHTTQNNTWQTVTVSATYLMELFPTQSNVLSIYYGQEKRFAHLTSAKSIITFKF